MTSVEEDPGLLLGLDDQGIVEAGGGVERVQLDIGVLRHHLHCHQVLTALACK